MLQIGRLLMILGAVLLVGGGFVYLLGRTGIPVGRLPGDFQFQRGNLTCFFPLATMILLSVVLTIVVNLILRYLNK
jgi:hypothetical protein